MDYLTFGEGPKSAGGLTKSWYVSSIGSQLGYVKWYAPWRKYCYFPAQDIVLDEHCLDDIASFCKTETILVNIDEARQASKEGKIVKWRTAGELSEVIA
ncbi:MAG: hypothetical protein ABSD89_12175 [Halobacteriota archaeon]